MSHAERQKDALPPSSFWYHVTPIIGATLIAAAYLAIKDTSFFGDEGYHQAQIDLFLGREWKMSGSLTTIPGMHALTALLSFVIGERSLAFMRFLVALTSIVGVFLTWKIAKILTPTIAPLRTLQVILFPILFPFFPLLYTDAVALTLVLGGLLLFLRKRYLLSLFLVATSVLVRQNSFVWLGCFGVAWLIEEHGRTLRQLTIDVWNRRLRAAMRKCITIVWSVRSMLIFLFLLVCAVAFGTFVVLNGGIAIGDQTSHPFPGVHSGNIFFGLFLTTVFFLPTMVASWRDMLHVLRTRWMIPVLVGLFILYMLTFNNSHWYNQGLDSVFLRNRVLSFIAQSPEMKTVAFLTIALGFIFLARTALTRPWNVLLYPFAVIGWVREWLSQKRW